VCVCVWEGGGGGGRQLRRVSGSAGPWAACVRPRVPGRRHFLVSNNLFTGELSPKAVCALPLGLDSLSHNCFVNVLPAANSCMPVDVMDPFLVLTGTPEKMEVITCDDGDESNSGRLSMVVIGVLASLVRGALSPSCVFVFVVVGNVLSTSPPP
jgi:hypothetical protein